MSASETKWVRLGEYIEQSDKRNSDGALTETDVQGIVRINVLFRQKLIWTECLFYHIK